MMCGGCHASVSCVGVGGAMSCGGSCHASVVGGGPLMLWVDVVMNCFDKKLA